MYGFVPWPAIMQPLLLRCLVPHRIAPGEFLSGVCLVLELLASFGERVPWFPCLRQI